MNHYFGDLHNHCGISYGHGSLADALANAREQLDFVSVTGHADWPDMPPRGGDVDDIIDFHERGFSLLRQGWHRMLDELRAADQDGQFVTFPAFEIHFSAAGDRNIFYRDLEGEILYPEDLRHLHSMLTQLRAAGRDSIAQPHHVGYRRGTRGIDWNQFDAEFAPLVEIVSMHGCSEDSETARPFLHSMGPSDWESTVAYGLAQGHVFGFTGGTDHHSAHPGSYGHGRVAALAESNTRAALWEAFRQRHTYALTGDNILLGLDVGGATMGDLLPVKHARHFDIHVEGGGALDSIDILRNGRLVKRFSPDNFTINTDQRTIETVLHLEVGWGRRFERVDWEVEWGISTGEIRRVEPRFRGREVVSPLEGVDADTFYESRILEQTANSVRFQTVTRGNPNNSTDASQGVALHVTMPDDAQVWAELNGQRVEWPLQALIAGARSGRAGQIDSPAWRFHRAPLRDEYCQSLHWEDDHVGSACYYVRVRQANDQWAWGSPVFFRDDA